MASTYKPLYAASATITIAPENIASSATWVAGVESAAVSNISNLYDDALVSGTWMAGTSPTSGTQVQVWVVAPQSDNLAGTVVWPDVFDGTSSAETVTSVAILLACAKLGGTMFVDSTTSNRAYYLAPFSIAALYGGNLPSQWALFITHNTGVNSNSTSGNHVWSYLGVQYQSV